jgi:hypothetical protein
MVLHRYCAMIQSYGRLPLMHLVHLFSQTYTRYAFPLISFHFVTANSRLLEVLHSVKLANTLTFIKFLKLR